MYQQPGNYPTQPVKKKGVGGLALAAMLLTTALVTGVGGCTVGFALGSAGDTKPQRESLTGISSSPTTRSFTPIPELVAYTPQPSDFELEVKETRRQCYGGSAGCVVTFFIDAKYLGKKLTSDQRFTVTYAVRGGNDPQTGSFEMVGSDTDDSEKTTIQVPSASKLTAKVTEIL